MLKALSVEKITFTGGEPLLYPFLDDLLAHAKSLDFTTMVVSNGSLITEEFLINNKDNLDWIGLSIDSQNEKVELLLKRGTGNHIQHIKNISKIIRIYSMKLKINVVVNSLNQHENLSQLLNDLKPDRLKFFQILEIRGENCDRIQPLLITGKQFRNFVERHKRFSPISETNKDMKGSYLMLDPLGRFFQNTQGFIEYSDSILECKPLEEIRKLGWKKKRFFKRGGLYDW